MNDRFSAPQTTAQANTAEVAGGRRDRSRPSAIDFPANSRNKETAFGSLGENQGETPMVVFHFGTGKRRAMSYGKIEFVDIDPSGVIDILLTDGKTHIIIKGRNLEKVHTALAGHKVKWIKQEDALHDDLNKDRAFVESIEWVETEDD